MKVDSPSELRKCFDRWRRGKRHVREAIPEELLERARRAMVVHGAKEVVRATRVERPRLLGGKKADRPTRKSREAVAVPSFSRVELAAPSVSSRPIVEVETPAGLKVRVYAETRESLGLLSSLCGMGATP